MRILHCVFTRSLFGSERYAADLARLQRQMGHEVHIAVDPRAEVQTILSPGITVHRVPWLARRLRLKRLIATLKPDIAHAHLSAACKALGAIAKRPPAVATLHVGYKPKQHARLDGLIALTEGAAARIHGYRGKVTRLWNWAPAMADPGPEARAAIRGELGVGPQTFLVGFVGRLHPSKDPQMLVRAFRAAALADSMLALAGDGPERADVERLAAGDPAIRLLGYRTDAPALYRAFDLFVLPSRFEQVPLAVLEAMQAGLPMAVSNIESLAEFVPAPPAHLFPPGDHGALAAILATERAKGQRRETWDLSPFDPKAQAARTMDFYAAVIGRP